MMAPHATPARPGRTCERRRWLRGPESPRRRQAAARAPAGAAGRWLARWAPGAV